MIYVTKEKLFKLHDDICNHAKWLMEKKNKDYSGGVPDVFANFRGSSMYGVEPEIGIMIRIQDKFKRIEAFIRNGTLAVNDESCRDSIEDIVNYTVLLAGMLEERKLAEMSPIPKVDLGEGQDNELIFKVKKEIEEIRK